MFPSLVMHLLVLSMRGEGGAFMFPTLVMHLLVLRMRGEG